MSNNTTTVASAAPTDPEQPADELAAATDARLFMQSYRMQMLNGVQPPPASQDAASPDTASAASPTPKSHEPLTKKETSLMRHALGLDTPKLRALPPTMAKRAYRNRFEAAGDDVAVWLGIVEKGLARRTHLDMSGNQSFVVTRAGILAVAKPSERELPTTYERHLMRHALGLEDRLRRGKRSYRNHFVASGEDESVWRDIVLKGLAVERKMSAELTGGSPCFMVTPDGICAVTKPSERKVEERAKEGKSIGASK